MIVDGVIDGQLVRGELITPFVGGSGVFRISEEVWRIVLREELREPDHVRRIASARAATLIYLARARRRLRHEGTPRGKAQAAADVQRLVGSLASLDEACA